jgi:hypothetical protein
MTKRRAQRHRSPKKAHAEPRERDAREPADNTQGGEMSSPPAALATPNEQTPKAQDGTTTPDSKRQPAKKSWRDDTRLQTVFIGVTAFVTSVYAIAAIYQWRATQEAIDQARVSRELENRAWVTVKEAGFKQFEPGKPVIAVLSFVNNGHTPAVETHSITIPELRDSSPPKDFRLYPIDTTVPVTNIGPDVRVDVVKQSTPLDAETLDVINTGKKKQYFYGVLLYDDIFGQHHHTTFCFFYNTLLQKFEDCGGDAD